MMSVNKRSRPVLSENVKTAVDDILNGHSVDSHTEWLQREYIRLMRREAAFRSEKHAATLHKESNFAPISTSSVPAPADGGAGQDWPAE